MGARAQSNLLPPFYKQQPDLNWRNPAGEKAMFDVLRFWLDRGIAGFRLDAITTLFEDPQRATSRDRRDQRVRRSQRRHQIYRHLPQVHDVMRKMRKLADSYPGDRVLIGVTYLPNTAALKQWYGTAARPELHLPMDMLVGFGGGTTRRPISAPDSRRRSGSSMAYAAVRVRQSRQHALDRSLWRRYARRRDRQGDRRDPARLAGQRR